MKPEIEAMVRLQSLDDRAADLQKEIVALPKHVAAIEQKLEAHTKRLEADRAALAANQKSRKGLEDDNKSHEQKISKLKDQMLGAKNNEQYKAFQNEIAYAETAIRKAEDQILEMMGTAESLDRNVTAAQESLAKERTVVEAEKKRAREQTSESQAALEKVKAERQALAAQVPQPMMAQYERARKRWRNSGVADATHGRCSACNIALRPQLFQDLKLGDKMMVCESCGRILYYNPPVSFEHELHQKV